MSETIMFKSLVNLLTIQALKTYRLLFAFDWFYPSGINENFNTTININKNMYVYIIYVVKVGIII